MLPLFSVLTSLVLASEFYSSNIFPKPKYEIQTVLLTGQNWNAIDYTWYPFFFGEGGTLAYTNFLLSTTFQVLVKIQDCFCEGDVFQLNNFDQSVVITQNNCNYPNQDTSACYYFSDDLDVCLTDGQHCTNSDALFDSGFNNLTITTLQSPLQFGRAYIGFKIND